MRVVDKLECDGNVVIACHYPPPNIEKDTYYTKEQHDQFDRQHKIKIDLSDAIYVVNVGGYIGSSTKNEIEYAKNCGKEVIYHIPVRNSP